LVLRLMFCFFFFFQAEDGIRDWSVTGVQTCALPIWPCAWRGAHVPAAGSAAVGDCKRKRAVAATFLRRCPTRPDRVAGEGRCARSEERRVGKEWRARGGGEG